MSRILIRVTSIAFTLLLLGGCATLKETRKENAYSQVSPSSGQFYFRLSDNIQGFYRRGQDLFLINPVFMDYRWDVFLVGVNTDFEQRYSTGLDKSDYKFVPPLIDRIVAEHHLIPVQTKTPDISNGNNVLGLHEDAQGGVVFHSKYWNAPEKGLKNFLTVDWATFKGPGSEASSATVAALVSNVDSYANYIANHKDGSRLAEFKRRYDILASAKDQFRANVDKGSSKVGSIEADLLGLTGAAKTSKTIAINATTKANRNLFSAGETVTIPVTFQLKLEYQLQNLLFGEKRTEYKTHRYDCVLTKEKPECSGKIAFDVVAAVGSSALGAKTFSAKLTKVDQNVYFGRASFDRK